MADERVHPSYQPVTSHVRDLADTIEALINEPDPLKRLAIVARELQPAVGYLMRDLVSDCLTHGYVWRHLGDAAATHYSTLHSQWIYGDGGPMISNLSKTIYRHRQPRNPGPSSDTLI